MVTIGTDIIEVNRIKSAVENIDFLNRIYTNNEIEYCKNTKQMQYQHYAVRFAAKEAIYKALSGKLNGKYDISWKDVEILNDNNGRPFVKFIKYPENIQNSLLSIDISLSHIKNMASATCVIEWRN